MWCGRKKGAVAAGINKEEKEDGRGINPVRIAADVVRAFRESRDRKVPPLSSGPGI
jgi:hypothetical protein